MPIPTKTPTVAEYFAYWLGEVIKPNREEGTYSAYELSGRLHVIPGLGGKRIDKLTVPGTQAWLNKIPATASAAPGGKTRRGLRGNAAAAPSASAARTSRAAA